MSGIGNNLYPPIVATYMSAFVRTQACRVYFSLSNYNSIDEIKNVQVIVLNQSTNLSALAVGKYPTGVMIANLQVDSTKESDDKYFITINPEDLTSGEFEINQYYKVQLRFTGVGATSLTNYTQIANWLVTNQSYFSEWSTVCLIKGIEQPEIYLKGFSDIESDESIFTSEVIDFVGSMYYSNNADLEKEYLKSFRIKIYRNASDTLVYDSDDVFTNYYNPNEINYALKTALEDGVVYKLDFTYTTVNEYSETLTWTFSIIQNTIDALNATITATVEEELARVRVDIVATIAEEFMGNLTIRRTSSESNFTIWEDIYQTTIANGTSLNYTWYDYTIESGVWYKYYAQKRNSKGDRGTIITIRNPIMAVFDDIFLTREGMQIKLKYNPQVTSFKKTLLESKTDTLGGTYPVIRRNGNVGYRQFPISGLITAFCDEEGVFINKENTYGDSVSYYEAYNEENDINEYQDYIYEREFREKVMDFLHASTVKLFRSTTEGNILVRLMDISFTPNQTLGRMLYTFNATAYEIDECSLENFEKYGIQSVGDYSTYLFYNYSAIGQLQGTYQGTSDDAFKLVQNKYSLKTVEEYINDIQYFKWLRIEFNMPPYLIKTAASGTLMPLGANEKADENTVLGYIVYINNASVLVSPRGIYELIDEDTRVTSVVFPVESDVTIDYIVEVNQYENTSLLYNKMYTYTKVGQLGDTFEVNENVFLDIYSKYLLNYVAYHQELLSLDKVVIEGVPGTICYIRDSFDDDFFKHEIGPTGVLEFYDDEAIVNGLKFGGVQLYERDSSYISEDVINISDNTMMVRIKDDALDITTDEESISLNENYFVINGNTVIVENHENAGEARDNEFVTIINQPASLDIITRPIKNGVYTVNNQRYIYYNAGWYTFSDDNIVLCPVDILIDYIYELMKGEY